MSCHNNYITTIKMDPSISADDYSEISLEGEESEINFCNEALIEAIHSRPPIWNAYDDLYKNRVIRVRLWEDILKELNIEVNSRNTLKIKKRWDQLRTSFMRTKKSPPSGSGRISMKPHRYEKLLTFLNDTNVPRKSINLCNFSESDSNEAIQIDVVSPTPKKNLKQSEAIQIDVVSPTPKKNLKQSEAIQIDVVSPTPKSKKISTKFPLDEYKIEKLHLKRKAVAVLETHNAKSSNNIFGEWVGSELDKMDESTQKEKKIKIMAILMAD